MEDIKNNDKIIENSKPQLSQKLKKINIEKLAKKRLCVNPFSPLFGVKIKKRLSADDMVLATANCLKEFFGLDYERKENQNGDLEFSRFDLFAHIKMIFVATVLVCATNIDVNGLQWNVLCLGGIEEYLAKHIKNYKTAWEIVEKSLELKNAFAGFNLITETIPNVKEMDKSVEAMSKLVKKMNDKDPEAFSKLVSTYQANSAFAMAQMELAKEKSKKGKQKKIEQATQSN